MRYRLISSRRSNRGSRAAPQEFSNSDAGLLDVVLSSGRAGVQARQDPSGGAMLLLRQKQGGALWSFGNS